MHPVKELQNYNLDRGQVEWVRNCDAHKKKVDVELLHNSVHRKFNQFGDQTSWRQDTVEKVSTHQREPSGPRLSSWGSDELEIRCGRENQHSEGVGPLAPGWAAQENGKETQSWPIEWGSIYCSSARSSTPSHTQRLKWEVYFSKELRRSSLLLCRRYDFACMCVCIVGYEYTTVRYKVILVYFCTNWIQPNLLKNLVQDLRITLVWVYFSKTYPQN